MEDEYQVEFSEPRYAAVFEALTVLSTLRNSLAWMGIPKEGLSPLDETLKNLREMVVEKVNQFPMEVFGDFG